MTRTTLAAIALARATPATAAFNEAMREHKRNEEMSRMEAAG